MQRHFYVVFYSWNNFGDDLFVLLLAKRYPHICFHISGLPERLQAFGSVPNIRIHKDTLTCRVLSKISRMTAGKDLVYHARVHNCEGILHIGGSIYIEPLPEIRQRFYRERKDLYIKGKPFWVIGANFGPYRSSEFLAFFREQFSVYNGVSFRDSASAQLFAENPAVSAAPDLVFTLRDHVARKPSENYVVFALMERLLSEGDAAYNAVRQAIRDFADSGTPVILLALCSAEGDLRICRKLQQELDHDRISVLAYNGSNMDTVLDTISRARMAVAMRFHGIVSALSLDVPVFPVAYSIKTVNMLQDAGFRGNWLPLEELSSITHSLILQNQDPATLCDAEALCSAAYRHFRHFDQYLSGEHYVR